MIGRREFIRTLGRAGATAVVMARPRSAGAEPPPETTQLRIGKVPSVCLSPQYVARELLHAEGFTDVRYIEGPGGVPDRVQPHRLRRDLPDGAGMSSR